MGSFKDFVASKRNLANTTIMAVLLSIGSAFGLMGHAGVTFNPVVATTAFLLLGLGVDDAYVLVQAYHIAGQELGESAVFLHPFLLLSLCGVAHCCRSSACVLGPVILLRCANIVLWNTRVCPGRL